LVRFFDREGPYLWRQPEGIKIGTRTTKEGRSFLMRWPSPLNSLSSFTGEVHIELDEFYWFGLVWSWGIHGGLCAFFECLKALQS